MERPNVPESEKSAAACCRCPFCDQSLEMPYAFCRACGAELHYCPDCGRPLPKDAASCPHCAEED